MNLAEVYDFLITEIGWIVIHKGEESNIFRNEQKCSNRKKLERLFYMITEYSTSDDDINKIMSNGLVRNNDRGASYFENMINNLMSNHMKMQMVYCEDIVVNSIVWGIAIEVKICEIVDKFTKIEEIKKTVQQKHTQIYNERYYGLQNNLISICEKEGFKFGKGMNCGEIISVILSNCLISMKIDENPEKKGYVGAKRSHELKNRQTELEKLLSERIKEASVDLFDEYYVGIWKEFHRIPPRDSDGSLPLDMIDIFIIPDIRTENDSKIFEPFNGRWKRQFLYAKSGIGKTFLLKSIVVASVVDYIFLHHKNLMSENEVTSYEKGAYKQISDYYFGNNNLDIVPIYIEAKSFNELSENEVIDTKHPFNILRMCNYYEMISSLLGHNEINKEKILFLIDSLDEIEERKSGTFNYSLLSLINRFKTSQYLITSRFSGRDVPIDRINNITLKGFDDTAISEYLCKCSFLEDDKKKSLLAFVRDNEYAFELAQNPFMLTTMFNVNNFSLIKCLSEISNAIIVRRFKHQLLSMTIDQIRAVLGYLAFCAILLNDQGNCFEKGNMTNMIREARDIGLIIISGESTDISDEQINLFTSRLSCQSGIINVTNQSGKSTFAFQDELVMCYLAAEFIYNLSVANPKYLPSEYVFHIHNRNSNDKNTYELTSFFDRVIHRDLVHEQSDFFKTLNMAILSESKILGRTVINYLLIKGFLTIDNTLLKNIQKCLWDYLNQKYGDSHVFNRKEDEEAVKLVIDRLLSI